MPITLKSPSFVGRRHSGWKYEPVPKPPFIRSSDDSDSEGDLVDGVDAPALQLEGADLTSIRIDSQTHLTFGATEVTIRWAKSPASSEAKRLERFRHGRFGS